MFLCVDLSLSNISRRDATGSHPISISFCCTGKSFMGYIPLTSWLSFSNSPFHLTSILEKALQNYSIKTWDYNYILITFQYIINQFTAFFCPKYCAPHKLASNVPLANSGPGNTFPLPRKWLVGILPNPYGSSLRDGCAFLRNAETQNPDGTGNPAVRVQ